MRKILQLCGRTLRKLDLSRTHITGETLSEGDGVFLTFMEELNISYCYKLTDTGLSSILNVCGKNLKKLDLSRTEITGENLTDVNGIYLVCLKELDLERCAKLTDVGLKQILQLCRRALKSLNISETQITGETLAEGNEDCLSCLEELNLEGCSKFTDTEFLRILQLCGKTLKSLNISCSNLTGEKLTEYNGTLPCIEHIDLENCPQFTDIGLIQLLQLPEKKLKSLEI